MEEAGPRNAPWLPPGKTAAVCLTIDDVHPGRSSDAYEAGGDLGAGVLGHVEWLLERHPALRVTLFLAADWREISPRPTRKILARVPFLRDRIYLSPILPKGTMRLDRHPDFVRYISGLPRTDVALHGLHHVHRGPRIPLEFQDEGVEECTRILGEALAIFREAGLEPSPGITPPGWDLPESLAQALVQKGLFFVASARDIHTEIAPGAKTAMSGLRNVSLIYPELIRDGQLVHLASNFQATSPIDRGLDIVRHHGLLAIKAHAVKSPCGYEQLDGLDSLYRNYLDGLFRLLEDRYGDDLWWTSMGEIASRVLGRNGLPSHAQA